MSRLWTVIILLLFQRSLAEEDAQFVMEQSYRDALLNVNYNIDFRCMEVAYSSFQFSMFDELFYLYTPPKKNRCAFPSTPVYYPPLTALDPMLPFYIDKIQENMAVVADTPTIGQPSKIKRRKYYCLNIRMIGSTFADYVEIFRTDDGICWKMMELVKECSAFQQSWSIWVKRIYGVFCMGEDGCYTTMELYEDDMPHCVKYIAKSQFQNVTFGSWHHSIINYCQLTDMVPDAKDTNYDISILYEDDKTEDDLMTMCQFLRFRLLPEEGKEEEIREITLENRDNRGPHTEADSAAFNGDIMIYVPIIMLTYGI